MFDPFLRAVSQGLAGLYSLPLVGGSFGVAIMLLTMSVMLLLMPLTLKATRSTIKMQHIQPQLKALQKEHKDDREKMNQELMKLYQENGINPVGGCLPMLAQLPVFLVLFRVLQGLTREASQAPFFDATNQARDVIGQAPLSGQEINPLYLDESSELYVDLIGENEMAFGPFDLASQAWDVLQDNFLQSIPYVLLIAFVVFTSYYQQRQVSARRGSDSVMNPQQQMLLRFLPLLSGFWSFIFPAGLVLYWATSNVFRIGQQAYITHQIYGKEAETGKNSPSKATDDGDTDDGDDRDDRNDKASKSSAKTKAASSGKKPSTKPATAKDNGAGADDGSKSARNRSQEWKKLRAEKQAKATSTTTTSSRVTPKGTKAPTYKKKRKR